MFWIASVFIELPFSPVKERFCQSVLLATQPHKRERKGKKQWCQEGCPYLLSHHYWLKGLRKNRRKVHFKNNRTFQRKYTHLTEKRLGAVIFIAQNAESFLKQFRKINKREVALSRPPLLTSALWKQCLSFSLCFKLRAKQPKRSKNTSRSLN